MGVTPLDRGAASTATAPTVTRLLRQHRVEPMWNEREGQSPLGTTNAVHGRRSRTGSRDRPRCLGIPCHTLLPHASPPGTGQTTLYSDRIRLSRKSSSFVSCARESSARG